MINWIRILNRIAKIIVEETEEDFLSSEERRKLAKDFVASMKTKREANDATK